MHEPFAAACLVAGRPFRRLRLAEARDPVASLLLDSVDSGTVSGAYTIRIDMRVLESLCVCVFCCAGAGLAGCALAG